MAHDGARWIEGLPAGLAAQQGLLRGLRAFSQDDSDVKWLVVGCALADLGKYVRRGSAWEALERLHEARAQLWQLWAAVRGSWTGSSGRRCRRPWDGSSPTTCGPRWQAREHGFAFGYQAAAAFAAGRAGFAAGRAVR